MSTGIPIAEPQTPVQPRKARKPTSYKLTESQTLLGIHLRELGLAVEYEHKFCERGWRFDLYLPEHRVGIELDGGMFRGGHMRGEALEGDYEKQNVAQMMGYRILRFTNRQALSGRAKEFIAECL